MTDSHGDCILRPGKEIDAWETRFTATYAGRTFVTLEPPIVDLGPGSCAFTRQASIRSSRSATSPT